MINPKDTNDSTENWLDLHREKLRIEMNMEVKQEQSQSRYL